MFNRPIAFLVAIIALAVGVVALERRYAAKPTVDEAFPRSDRDAALYDLCLAQDGNRTRCDAIMRVIDRSRAAKVSEPSPP